jgi:predicted PurR-regulated permease PerM
VQERSGYSAMKPVQPGIFWIATLAVAAAMLVLLREILLPFVAGIALAYLLAPLVDWLERIGLNRAVAALGIIVLSVGFVIATIVLVTPILGSEIALLVEKFPGYVAQLQTLAENPSHPWLHKIIGEGLSEAEQATGSVGASWIMSFLGSLWSDGKALISIFSLLVVTPIVAFYLINNWKGIVATLDRAIPATYRDTVQALARDIDETIAAFLRGQGTICLILALYYSMALKLIGLNHGLLIGLASGLLSFVPYLGLLAGLLISVSVTILQFWPSWTIILIILGLFVVGESVANYALSPHLVGARVNLDPAWVIFAISAFGYLFGFVGLLIAVPLAASIGVLVRFAIAQYSAASHSKLPVPTTNGGVPHPSLEERGRLSPERIEGR